MKADKKHQPREKMEGPHDSHRVSAPKKARMAQQESERKPMGAHAPKK